METEQTPEQTLACPDCGHQEPKAQRHADTVHPCPVCRVEMRTLAELEDDEDEDEESGICGACNGSGEGMYDGSTCYSCGGAGEACNSCGRGPRQCRCRDDYDPPGDW